MFADRETRLRERQLGLRLRSAELRAALSDDAERLRPALALGDRGLQVWGWLKSVPQPARLLPIAGLLLLLRRPGRLAGLAGWALRGMRWWRLLRQLSGAGPGERS